MNMSTHRLYLLVACLVLAQGPALAQVTQSERTRPAPTTERIAIDPDVAERLRDTGTMRPIVLPTIISVTPAISPTSPQDGLHSCRLVVALICALEGRAPTGASIRIRTSYDETFEYSSRGTKRPPCPQGAICDYRQYRTTAVHEQTVRSTNNQWRARGLDFNGVHQTTEIYVQRSVANVHVTIRHEGKTLLDKRFRVRIDAPPVN